MTFGVPLDRYLGLAADRNLRNRIQAETRRRAKEGQYARDRPTTIKPTFDGNSRREALAGLVKAACGPYELKAEPAPGAARRP